MASSMLHPQKAGASATLEYELDIRSEISDKRWRLQDLEKAVWILRRNSSLQIQERKFEF